MTPERRRNKGWDTIREGESEGIGGLGLGLYVSQQSLELPPVLKGSKCPALGNDIRIHVLLSALKYSVPARRGLTYSFRSKPRIGLCLKATKIQCK